MSLHFRTATSADEAHRLLSSSPLPLDSPTQRRIRGDLHLTHVLDTGRRRADWVWVAEDGEEVIGTIAGHGDPTGQLHLLDHFWLPDDPEFAVDFFGHVTDHVRRLGAEDLLLFGPPGSTRHSLASDPATSALISAIESAGWRHLIDRLHYEFEPTPDLAGDIAVDLRFESVTDQSDPRLVKTHRQVMVGTLDAHDAEATERLGYAAACRESLQFLLDADPVECIHLAFDAEDRPVGMISGRAMPGGRAFVLFVGVAQAHRGRHYSRQLLAWMTRRLLAQGGTTLIADTDVTNTPMAAGFAAVGWPVTESRIDFVLR